MDTYEKKYNEALKRAKAAIDIAADKDLVKGVASTIFPELRESEDERMRELVINRVRSATEMTDGLRELLLNYLEKQKEQKPNIELIQRSWYMEGYHDREFGKEPMWIIKTGEGGPRHEENPKYGQMLAEQKPVEWEDIKDKVNVPYCSSEQEWSEEDEKMLSLAIEWAETMSGQFSFVDMDSTDFRKIINWLKSLRPSWKPSEEQMKALGAAIVFHKNDPHIDMWRSLYDDLQKIR